MIPVLPIIFFPTATKIESKLPQSQTKMAKMAATGPNSVQENKTYAEKHYYLFARASKIKRL